MQSIIEQLGHPFGVLSRSDTTQLTVIARNEDVSVGDLFVLPSRRGKERFYFFRTTQYANIMNRTVDLDDVARNKLTMANAYLSDDLQDEKLIELRGLMLGYAQQESNGYWTFNRPRRLPEHLSDVYRVNKDNAEIVRELLASQLGQEGIFLGYLLVGEEAQEKIPVYMPPHAISHHIGIFGRTGCGKSNLMMVLIASMLDYNQRVERTGQEPKVSLLAIDPHDEFCTWPSGRRGGIRGIVKKYDQSQWERLVDPFYYLTSREVKGEPGQETIRLSRADIVPQDLFSIMEFSEQQTAFANLFYNYNGEMWISNLISGDLGNYISQGVQFLQGTVEAVERRVSFLQRGQTQVFNHFDPDTGKDYRSLLPEVICALESGRIISIDTTLMSEMEQFLITTIIARTLFTLRKALKSAQDVESLEDCINQALGVQPGNPTTGMRSFARTIIDALRAGRLPYIRENRLTRLDELPLVNVVIEEAPSVLNPDRMRFGSVFRDISRQGRKFGIGLTVISQQVSAIDQGILTQLNTEITLALGNESERREAIKNASTDLYGFEKELQVMGKGQAILTASYRDVPLPVQAPLFDDL
jgi:DNA helicase HerA-like ATPase